MKNSNVKRHKSAKYPKLEKILYEWFLQYYEKVNMTGEMIQTKAKEFLQKMSGETNLELNFSNGWLDRFKARLELSLISALVKVVQLSWKTLKLLYLEYELN
ncbi:hypothetical protein ACOSP7_014591 [Xanthoceras sorbifolium]